jgi:hypothetical protein
MKMTTIIKITITIIAIKMITMILMSIMIKMSTNDMCVCVCDVDNNMAGGHRSLCEDDRPHRHLFELLLPQGQGSRGAAQT